MWYACEVVVPAPNGRCYVVSYTGHMFVNLVEWLAVTPAFEALPNSLRSGYSALTLSEDRAGDGFDVVLGEQRSGDDWAQSDGGSHVPNVLRDILRTAHLLPHTHEAADKGIDDSYSSYDVERCVGVDGHSSSHPVRTIAHRASHASSDVVAEARKRFMLPLLTQW